MNQTVIVEDLVKIYSDGTRAVDGVSFTAGRGVTMLMGPNGSGKTTTLSIVAGALAPTKGRILVCDYEVWGSGWEKARECIGFAPQNMPFRERLTLLENLVWYGLIRGIGFRESKQRALELLETVGLREHYKKKVAQISGGMRRRLMIAAALIGDPEVLILDEPTSGLDPSARRVLWNLIRDIARDKTIIASTHIAEDAEENADKVLIFHKGKIVASGEPELLIRQYAPEAVIVVEGALKGSFVIEGAKLLKSSQRELRYSTRDPDHVLPLIIEKLLSQGSKIEKVEVRKSGLTEVYLELTGVELSEV